MVTGDSIQYVAGGGTITPRLADDVLYRKAHEPRPPKPTGLDWDALTPTCSGCEQKSGQIDGTGLCPGCRGDIPVTANTANVTTTRRGTYQHLDDHDVAHRFTAPTQTPQDEEDEPKAASPSTAPHRAQPTQHENAAPRPAAPTARPTVRANVTRTGTHDVLITLRSTADPINQVTVPALLTDLLHQLNPQTPAAATSTPTAAGPMSEGRTRVGKPARPSDTPKSRKPRVDTFDLEQATRLYLDQRLSTPQIAAQLGCAVSTVQRKLKAAGVPMRDDRGRGAGGKNRFVPTPEQTADITHRYVDQQLSTTTIGDLLGVDRRVIRSILRANGVTIRPPSHQTGGTHLSDADHTAISTAYAAGESISDLARHHHVRTQAIRDIVTAAGHTIRPKGASTRIGDRIAALGCTAHDIKQWAVDSSLVPRITPGLVPAALIDAYETAHPTPANPATSTTTEGENAA